MPVGAVKLIAKPVMQSGKGKLGKATKLTLKNGFLMCGTNRKLTFAGELKMLLSDFVTE